MATNHVIFIYGTLKSGESNRGVMRDPETGVATFVGVGHTVKKYPLIVASQYNFGLPSLLHVEGKGENVEGEVYEVDDSKLARLDEFEDHPDFYRSEKTDIAITEDEHRTPISPATVKECWVYFLSRYEPEMVNMPHLKKYSSYS